MTHNVTIDRELARIVGERWVMSTRLARAAYTYDSGTTEGWPDAVVLPGNREELVRVLAAGHRAELPVVIRGAGTCLSGGPVALHGGIVVVLVRLNRLLWLDPVSRVALVEPGMVNAALQRAAGVHGLGFMPDPSSSAISTLGGNAAENAGGPRALRHGVFRRHLLGLEFALADGSLMATGQLDPVPCPDLPRPAIELASLLAGSEGTLAVITRLAVGLAPLPARTATMMALFRSPAAAGATVSLLLQSGLVPEAAEIVGALDIELANRHLGLGLPASARAMLLIELAGQGPGLTGRIEQARSMAIATGAISAETALDSARRDRLWRARRASTGLYGQVRPASLSGDVTVPRRSLAGMIARVDELAAESGLLVGLVGHAGDGNLHPAVLFDPADPSETAAAHALDRAIVATALQFGGSPTGEHGIGSEKLEFMSQAFPPATLGCFGAVKRAFDPSGHLNPGKVLPAGSAAAVPPVPRRTGAAGEDRALARIGGVLGERLQTGPSALSAFGLGGHHRPSALAMPSTIDELAEIGRIAQAHGLVVWPLGSGGLMGTAFRAFDGGLGLSLAGMQQVLEICPEDLVARVQAGCTAGQLGRALDQMPEGAGGGMSYPVDPWRTPRSTLGAEVATNACGPGRPHYGSTRDRVLGLTLVTVQGDICRAGSRTLKDVAGYDLARTVCGSWGTLATVAEVTLRLEPKPEAHRTLLLTAGDAAELGQVFLALRCQIDACAAELLAPRRPGTDRWRLLVGLAGWAEEVDGSLELVGAQAVRSLVEMTQLEGVEADAAWDEARRRRGPALCRSWAADGNPWLAGYLTTTPAAVGAATAAVHRALGCWGSEPLVSACWPLGVIDFGVRLPARDTAGGAADSGAGAVLARVREAMRSCGLPGADGNAGFYGSGGRPGEELPAPYSPELARLIGRLKSELDPEWLLAPASRALPLRRMGPHASA